MKCVIDNDMQYFVQNGAKKGGKKLHGIKLMKWTSKYINKGWTIILEIFIYLTVLCCVLINIVKFT